MLELLHALPARIYVMVLGAVPIIEVKGAIPAGVAMGFSPWESLGYSLIGNLLVIPILLLFLQPICRFLRTHHIPVVSPLARGFEDRTVKKSQKMKTGVYMGLFLLVALPLPGTGVWTGSLAASLMNIKFRHALPIVVAGGLVGAFAIFIMTSLLV